jgi:hypothetical protein
MRNRVVAYTAGPLAFLVAMAGTALAVEAVEAVGEEEPTEKVESTVVIDTQWDDKNAVVIVSLGEDGESPCQGDGEAGVVTAERDDDGKLVVKVDGVELGDGEEVPAGCLIFDGTGPNGQVNKGTMISSVAKNLSPHDLDVPKGWLMRDLAKEKVAKENRVKPKDLEEDGEKAAKKDKDSLEEKRADGGNRGNSEGRGRAGKAGNKKG